MSEAPRVRPFSVQLFMPEGDPSGLKFVEKTNWIGLGMVIPRVSFTRAKQRPELSQAGVYFLIGGELVNSLPSVYVGHGDPVQQRLEEHAKLKEFWTHAVVFVSKDRSLNKAHVQRLEGCLVDLARAAKRCQLHNANSPQSLSLSEAETAHVDAYLADLLLCLPILGYSVFESPPTASPLATLFTLSGKGIKATGFESSEGFVVVKGSTVAKQEADTIPINARLKRAELLANGVLQDVGSEYQMTQDYTFNSPSAAACFVLGNSTSGPDAWKAGRGRTLKSIQAAEMN